MININNTTVAVETSAELKNILESDNSITTVHFANDITLESGISILGTKQSLIIDGLYPLDGSGKIHTYTDMNSASNANAIGIRSSSSIKLTFKNMNVIGRNYYGIIFVSESTNHQDVVITYENITYSGPQITYHPSGLSIYKDVNITIVASSACPANEVAEAAKLQIGGNTTIVHNSTSNSTFWLRGYTNDAYLEILENSHVYITTAKDIFYSQYYVKISILESASLDITTKYGMFRDSGHQASNITLHKDSILSIIQQQSNGSIATIYCRERFLVNQGSTLYIQANYSNTAPLIQFTTNSAKLDIIDPKKILLYNNSYNCFSFSNSTLINISCRKIDYWLNSPNLLQTGIVSGTPLYSWFKNTEDLIDVIATSVSNKTTISSNNLTQEEIASLPNLDLLQLQSVHTLRLLPNGDLILQSAPEIIEFQRPVINTNPVILGRKDETLSIIVVDTRGVSSTWYLYAYINAPLTTNDGKHFLEDSLIFVDDVQNIYTLTQDPLLIYTGTASDGNEKLTTITFERKAGILFKVIDPLYTNQIYKTKINWVLSKSKL